ncbi:MAG: glutamate synthase, partial [Thermoprotei archaeon]
MKFTDIHESSPKPEESDKRIAIIGSGPAGLAAARHLISKGYEVHVYERLPEPGGMLLFTIPSHRLPKERIRENVKELVGLGIKFYLRTKIIGKPEPLVEGDELVRRKIKFNRLLDSYDAILIATGAWRSRRLGIPGEHLDGIYYALDYLFKVRSSELGYLPNEDVPPIGRRVAVIGAGLAAIDAAEEALRQGAEKVSILYRRTINEAPAGKHEIERVMKKGIEFVELVSPVEFLGIRKVEAIKLRRVRLGAPDETGRPKPELIPGSDFIMKFDTVILAIGEVATPPFISDYKGIKVMSDGRIQVDNKYRTTKEGVFAAGDVVTGPSRVGLAIKSGIEAANAIDDYL